MAQVWRKHYSDFLVNAKIVTACRNTDCRAALLAITILDLNCAGDRHGILGREESSAEFLCARLRLVIPDLDRSAVDSYLTELEASRFIHRDEVGRVRILGWNEAEFGVRGNGRLPAAETKQCDFCGSPFTPTRYGNRFCSESCRKSYHRDAGRERTRTDADGDGDAKTQGRETDARKKEREIDRGTEDASRPRPSGGDRDARERDCTPSPNFSTEKNEELDPPSPEVAALLRKMTGGEP
jgi:hypothetical protein